MTTWAEFEAAAPEMARSGRRLLEASGHGSGLLATVREGTPPRIHPVSVDIIDGELWVFLLPSPKLTDMVRDGRYALHTHHDLAAPDEFMIRGRARHVEDEHIRAKIGSESNRGSGSQSMDPSSETSAPVPHSPISPYRSSGRNSGLSAGSGAMCSACMS